MISNKYFLTLLISISTCHEVFSKTLETVEETEELSLSVMAFFFEEQYSDAFDLLKKYWPLPDNEINLLEEKTIKMMNTVSQRFGKSIDYIRVRREAITDIASRETYLLRFDNTAIRVIFTYYLNSEGWIVNAFKWDDSFEQEFRVVE